MSCELLRFGWVLPNMSELCARRVLRSRPDRMRSPLFLASPGHAGRSGPRIGAESELLHPTASITRVVREVPATWDRWNSPHAPWTVTVEQSEPLVERKTRAVCQLGGGVGGLPRDEVIH